MVPSWFPLSRSSRWRHLFVATSPANGQPPTEDTSIFFSFLVPDLTLLSYLTALFPSLAFSYCLAMLSCLPIWQPGIGAQDGLTGISHQLYTCLPWNSATDFPLGVEVILRLQFQHFDTHQTLPRTGCGSPFCLLDKPSIITYKTRLVANRTLRGDFQEGDTFAYFCLYLRGGQTHSKAGQNDSQTYCDLHIVPLNSRPSTA